MRRTILRTSALLLVAALAGCQGDDGRHPPTVRFGHEACAHCRMIISDDRYAAACVTESGEARKFDEISCLIAHRDEHPEPVKRCWVRSYRPPGWLDASQASFVHSRKLPTPMGAGIAALATTQDAEELARELEGQVLRFDQLPALLAGESTAGPPRMEKSR